MNVGLKSIVFNNVSFLYESSLVPLFSDITITFSQGWTAITGVNGSGKTTLLQLATGLLQPAKGTISIPDNRLYCQQRTDHFPDAFEEFMYDFGHHASKLKSLLNIEFAWLNRWDTLSHGERKKIQVAIALWHDPQVLAIDEPANHLDLETRKFLQTALKTYKGIGLLISHDRDLLDMCTSTVLIKNDRIIFRNCNYSEFMIQEKMSEDSLKTEYEKYNRKLKKMEHKYKVKKTEASEANKKLSKKHLNRKDHDAKAKIDSARLKGKDTVDTKKAKQYETKIRFIKEKIQDIIIHKKYPSSITINGDRIKRDILLDIPQNTINLADDFTLEYPALTITPSDRIALVGNNGSGKSTLMKHIVHSLTLPPSQYLYIPQEITIGKSKTLLHQIRQKKGDELGKLFTIITRLGSDPEKLLQTELSSPGEIRKMVIADGILRNPGLLLLDEPTNHLDLKSVESLEKALNECASSLLFVSHDKHFISRLARKYWVIKSRQSKKHYYVTERLELSDNQ